MNPINKIKNFLQTRGYDLRMIKGQDLNDVNITSKALTKEEALEALGLYSELNVPILGGDVFYLNQIGELKWTYDNWYCTKSENENNTEYLKRSINEAAQYVKNYQNDNLLNCTFLFDIVIANETSLD